MSPSRRIPGLRGSTKPAKSASLPISGPAPGPVPDGSAADGTVTDRSTSDRPQVVASDATESIAGLQAQRVGPDPGGESDAHRAAIGDGIAFLAAYRRAVLSWIAGDGYPMNVDIEIDVKPAEGTVRFGEPAGFRIEAGTPVAITGSHMRALSEGGFDERSHVTVWGPAVSRPRGRFAVTPTRVWMWGERDLALGVSYDRRVAQARRYYEALSVARGVYTSPPLSGRLAVFRAVHSPSLGATLVPLLLGLAVALRAGVFDTVTAVLTFVMAGAACLAVDIAEGRFDLLHTPSQDGAAGEQASVAPGPIERAVARARGVPPGALSCFAVAAILGVVLLAMRGSPELVLIAVVGVLLAGAYRTPPLELADRGLGEMAAAVGFGPVLLLGAYAAQSRGPVSAEAIVLSLTVGLLAGLVVLVNEIPNRAGDAAAGRLTIPARWPKTVVIRGYELACGGAFVAVAVGVAAGRLPLPVLLALLAAPTAMRVRVGLISYYRRPVELASVVAANVRLHLDVGLLIGAGYGLTIADQIFLGRAPFLW